MKITAAVPRAQGKPRPYDGSQPMTIETVDLDQPGPGEVFSKSAAVGLCHSDPSTIENLPWAPKWPSSDWAASA